MIVKRPEAVLEMNFPNKRKREREESINAKKINVYTYNVSPSKEEEPHSSYVCVCNIACFTLSGTAHKGGREGKA